ncbi:MAG: sugar ABC transporter permease [Rhodobacteraceae bacterium]|jgi:multiple sugar transport system permease protein|uniref:Carbohydrate ABC transporter membrane protein 1, CUT1 family n=1 Tax=Salipiger profundus TaxID=1229727 RepID=A0A1U7DCQ6_9RHOB|nr:MULTISPECIES: sugar ABC transporter permease [Salipiger]APX25944.1 carbohydrate ABC transporter membrane protein 1, CUT1 family [Salipiger profundus]MAB05035.1 sugar ABC transporter permease [Paracoccaceae bacterium]SFC83669.1 carbohydrate ABC transporter membrane protein 1, CUT1 family [Salipiger profundus]
MSDYSISRARRRLGRLFAAPGLSVLAITMGLPLGYALVISLSNMTLIRPRLAPFQGLENYLEVLSDPMFWSSLGVTLRFSAASVIGEFVVGLGIALLLTKVVRMRAIYFAILTLPMAMSPVAVALIWKMLLQPNLGIINTTLAGLGIAPVDWLGTSDLALSTLVFVEIWQQTSFVVLLLSAGLASMPRDPFEAAEVDGAGPLAQFWYITLPMLRPVASIAIVIQLINEFRTYDLVYVMTKGGPGISTELLSFFAYKRAFQGLAINEGNAAAFLLLLVVLSITVVFFWLLERRR